MEDINLIFLVASIASIVLALLAIWLSLTFYKLSSENSRKSDMAMRDIRGSVEKLEQIFNTLYSDTFSMMRDTVQDVTGHLWSSRKEDEGGSKEKEEMEKKILEKVSEVKKELKKDIDNTLSKQRFNEKKISSISQEIENILDKSINQLTEAEEEVKEETIRKLILKRAKEKYNSKLKVAANEIVFPVSDEVGVSVREVVDELVIMRNEGIISWRKDLVIPNPNTLIGFAPQSK